MTMIWTRDRVNVAAGHRPADSNGPDSGGMAEANTLEIQLLGDVALKRGATLLTLPPSKKTRALLAYLVMTGRPHRRERLCAMLWEMPDDPRGALRWSLSKLRSLVDEPDRPRIRADRDTVGFDADEGIEVDVLSLRRALAHGSDALSTDQLQAVAGRFDGEFLEGLDLQDCHEFQAWCVAEREQVRGLQTQTLQALIGRLSDEPDTALPYARTLARIAPYDESAQAGLLQLLATTGRRIEAERHYAIASRRLTESRLARTGVLDRAWHDARAGRIAAAPVPGSVPSTAPAAVMQPPPEQEIRFCTAPDGVRLAYACCGSGTPLVKTANWMNHLEYDWQSPVYRHALHFLAANHRLIRYDERGNGLSDWEVADISFEAFVRDLETVVDTLALPRFALFGISQGASVAVAYAVRHPERVSHIVLYGGYVKGWRKRGSPAEIERREAMNTLILRGWGQDNPAFRQMFTSLFMPGAAPEQMQWFNDLQRITTPPQNAHRLQDCFADIDVSALLPLVQAPTLVLHCRNDAVAPFAQGREFALGIPGARFVPLEGSNHLILEDEPAWARFQAEVKAFLAS